MYSHLSLGGGGHGGWEGGSGGEAGGEAGGSATVSVRTFSVHPVSRPHQARHRAVPSGGDESSSESKRARYEHCPSPSRSLAADVLGSSTSTIHRGADADPSVLPALQSRSQYRK
jgi:hypothetical protein